MDLFKIRQTNEEKNDFIVTVGNHLATEKHFTSEKEAEDYIESKPWDVIVALVAEMIVIHEQKDELK